MSKKLMLLALILFTLTIFSAAFAGQYSQSFPQYLALHTGEAKVTAIITMADQVNLRAIQDQLYAQHADRRLWHETVVRALQEKATLSQANLLSVLSSLQQTGQVQDYTSIWLGNMIIVTATPQTFDQLVLREDILQVGPNYEIENNQPVSEDPGDTPVITGHEIGADWIHASECWAIGITGEGRLVSHLDTGVDGNHPALTERWRGNADPRYADHPEWAWFDPISSTTYPQDWGQHGTHTMGTICGRSTETDDTVGVAIDAQWISAGVIDRPGTDIATTYANALLSFEWVVDPDGDPSTVWDVPDVCSNSWGVGPNIGGYPHCDDMLWGALDACEAAGIVVVFAAGNEAAGGLRVPADRASTELTSFAIGAVDGDNPDLPIAYFSSLGPTYCTPDGSEAIKPEIVAPGMNVRSSIPGGGYQGGWSGTSMATPHIAGIVALMRQANPNLSSEQIRQILIDTAVETPADNITGDDNTYGHGIANAYAAVQVALALLNGWGTLSGVISDQASGTPLPGARISVLNRPWSAVARPGTGQYFLLAPADTAWTLRIENPPTHLPIIDTITIVENDTIFQNYALEGKVTVALKASFGNPTNVDYRSFYLKGSWNSDGFYDASWSAPLMEIKDDGNPPDQTAGDGVFTGSIMLARDLAHTYAWAIYTENYGGEGARLQNGANFQILSLVPPTVPTLAVNPSGSDHNWGISAFGTHSLNLDLSRVDANHPTKWAAACSLFTGNTYAFYYRVMHSNVAKYGAGGIGGDSIRFTPTVSGAYDFIFDDRNDSYIVQLSGTEGPPVYVSAQSGLDGHIPVSWLPPGTTESTELFFDDGTCNNGWRYFSDDNLYANMFVPDAWPVVVDSIMIHLFTEGDPFWPWPDGTPDPVAMMVFLDDGSGNPQPDPVFYTEVTGELGLPWLRIDVPDILVSEGNFWVAMQNLPTDGEEGMGQDVSTDYPANKWARENGTWIVQDIFSGDQMIRAKVFGGARDLWLSYDSTPAGEIPSTTKIGGNPNLATGTGRSNTVLSAINSPRFNLMAYHPNKIRNNTPTIMDTQVLAGYNLYRDINPGPFNRPGQTKINTGLIIATLYDDWGTDVHGPIVNGVTYHYQASAVYDIGSGQFVEVGPSNEVTGVAENHPPANPVNLTGYAAGHDVHLTWNRNTDYDIQSYKVYRRDPEQPNYTLIATVAHPDTTFHEVIAVNGIYKYKIAAFDNGGMQSDGFSNSLNIAIGAIPPCNLRASDDQEFQVSLAWNHPGGCGGDMTVLVIGSEFTSGDASMFMDEMMTYSDVVQIDYYDARMATPTLEDLAPYNVVIVWSNYQFNDANSLGDLLADYVDNGGGVVLNEFCFAEVWALGGRIMSDYSPVSAGVRQLTTHSLGDFDPTHPIMEGVSAVTEFFQAGVTLVNNGVLVAAFDDGNPLVAVNPDMPVAIVNGYVGNQRQFTGDMSLISHNALKYVSGGSDAVIPQNYKVYKASNVGGPFNLLATLPGTQRNYVDGPVPNGVDYWYRITSIFPGPEESAPSNVVNGRALNHPPSAPFNLAGTVNDRTIAVTWSFANTMSDFAHFNVYKRVMPSGSTILVGSPTDSSFSIVIPIGEDGVYKITVTAVDNGNPPMESVPSREIYKPVGHLPPTSLVAVSGEEFRVPLAWQMPGSWRLLRDDHPYTPIKVVPEAPQPLKTSQKGETGPVNPPVIVNQGGPDEFGYSWIDSDEPGGPTYQWRDIVGIGQQIPMNGDDLNLGPFDLGFDFNFYGNTFSQFFACSNGWISFTDNSNLLGNTPLPDNSGGAPFNLVAPFWDDLNFASGGELWYNFDGTELVISYIGVPHYSSGGPYTFQIVLRSSGSIYYEYQSLVEPTAECTVGIQNADGTIGLTATYNAAYLHDEMAIRFGVGPEGIPPAYFKVYRSTTAGVPIDPAHLLAGHIDGNLTTYTDMSGLQNGTHYYYKVTAVWQDSIESGSTNEAEGTPANHAPSAPFNVAGTVNDRTINAHWSFSNSVGDLAHYNVYKKLRPDGATVLVGSPTDTSFAFNIPIGEDGIYVITVTAVDNGNPPMESMPSEELLLPVGHLFPQSLVALGGRDHIVPLTWDLPGSGRILKNDRSIVPDQITTVRPQPLDLTKKGETGPINLPVLLDQGGPDEFGYTWKDSDEPGGPAFQWIDIVDIGEQIPMAFDDENLGPYDIGFDFSFYGNTFSQFYICSNGWISFTDVNGYFFNYPLPGNIGTPLNLVAPFWDDLYPPNGGQYWYHSDGNQLVISFIDVPHIGGTGPYTFQMVLKHSGEIYFEYQTLGTPTNECTVGIQNEDGTIGLGVTYNADYLHDEMAIKLSAGLTGFNPAYFKLYRATAPNVPINPAHLVAPHIDGTLTSYTDSLGLTNGTTYYYKLTAFWQDSVESGPSNEAFATPVMGARMILNPLSFNASAPAGGSVTLPLNISNPGGINLDYAIDANSGDRILKVAPSHTSPIKRNRELPVILDKTNPRQEQHNPPMLFGRGGPDEFGYQWIDSDEPNGPTYSWEDITDRGTSISLADDGILGPFDLGFDFNFYGESFSQIYIAGNGVVNFSGDYVTWSNVAIPDPSAPRSMIAPFWTDLAPNQGGEVWYYSDGNRMIISYIGVPHYDWGTGTGPYTFQIIISPNGSTVFNYMDMQAPLNESTIGIQNGDGSIGLQTVYNQDYMHNEMTIRITSGWLSADPTSGTIAPAGNFNASIIFDASTLTEGVYNGTLTVTGTDTYHQVGQVSIPVTFHVTPLGVDDPISALPTEFGLSQNYPNPFNPTTEIEFALPTRAHVSLDIYNVMGQRVRALVNSNMEAGYKSILWNGADDGGNSVASGTYFYVLKAGDKVFTKKMTMLK